MPPKKNKAPRNGFYYFMMDYKIQQGRHFNSLKEVAEVAGPIWSNMPEQAKKPYIDKARYVRNDVQGGLTFNSDGMNIQMLEEQEKKEQERIEAMKSEINNTIQFAYKSNRLPQEMFFLVHINVFCQVLSENRFYPAEVAIAGFNLEDGVLHENVFHRIIKPGPLPIGYAGDAQSHSRAVHQIPVPVGNNIENNVQEVFDDLKKFLKQHLTSSRHYPALYTDAKLMKQVQEVLDTWCLDNKEQPLFAVYNFQYMFRVLRNTVAKGNIWPYDAFCVREMERDVYAFTKSICCELHEVTNVPQHCSKSIVVRYAFTVCDHCCGDLNIQLLPGQHVPEDSCIPIIKSSRASSRASFSSRESTRNGTDDDTESVLSISSKSEWDNRSETTEASTDRDDQFLSLGLRKKLRNENRNPWPSRSTSASSQHSLKSYLHSPGTSGLSQRPSDMPPNVLRSLEKLDFNSQSDSSENGKYVPFGLDLKVVPGLGRGRGFTTMGRGSRRPNGLI